MSVANEIAAKLAALGVGVVGTSIFIGALPATPDVACAVIETGGVAPTMGFGTAGIKFERPALQLLFRGAPGDYATPRATAGTAYAGLAAVEATTLSAGVGGTSAFYHWVHPVQAPFLLRRDESQRVVIAFNVRCEKEPSA